MEIIVFIGYTDGYIMFIVADCGIQVDQQNDIHIIISIAHVAPNSGKLFSQSQWSFISLIIAKKH